MAQSNRMSPARDAAERRGGSGIAKEPRHGIIGAEAEEIAEELPPSGAPTEAGPRVDARAEDEKTGGRRGITNHPVEEERNEQEQLPPRGDRKH